jgi:hypothetical protein
MNDGVTRRVAAVRFCASLVIFLASMAQTHLGLAADEITIRTNGVNRVMDCGSQHLSVDGDNSRLQLTNCPDVVVRGNHNSLSITFRMHGHVSLVGNANTVIWRNRPGIPTEFKDSGAGNRVERVPYE